VAQVFEALAEGLVDAVVEDVEKAIGAAGVADGGSDLIRRGAQIDHWQAVHRPRW